MAEFLILSFVFIFFAQKNVHDKPCHVTALGITGCPKRVQRQKKCIQPLKKKVLVQRQELVLSGKINEVKTLDESYSTAGLLLQFPFVAFYTLLVEPVLVSRRVLLIPLGTSPSTRRPRKLSSKPNARKGRY